MAVGVTVLAADADDVVVGVKDCAAVADELAPKVTLAVMAAVVLAVSVAEAVPVLDTVAVGVGEGGGTQASSVALPCAPRPSVAPLPYSVVGAGTYADQFA